MFPRLFIWLTLLFAGYTILRMMQGSDSNMYNFISWNEFYHEMLAKGEVSQSITFPLYSCYSLSFKLNLENRTLKASLFAICLNFLLKFSLCLLN